MSASQDPRGPISTDVVEDVAAASEVASHASLASVPPHAPAGDRPFVTGSHESLFVANAADEASRCDVCGAKVEDETSEGYAVSGRGLYVWSRGGEVRFEEPPLCPACAVAVGMSAMARWEIEEEEG
jgi:hypothetical protein